MEYPLIKVIGKEEATEVAEDSLVNIESFLPVYTESGEVLLEERRSGELKGHAFYLSRNFDWRVATDTRDRLVLVPTKKIPSK